MIQFIIYFGLLRLAGGLYLNIKISWKFRARWEAVGEWQTFYAWTHCGSTITLIWDHQKRINHSCLHMNCS